LLKSDVLEIAIDAAESIDARNSFEKMLAHQLTACHVAAMQSFAEVESRRTPYRDF